MWWAIANFRETQLRHIHPGTQADVYVLSRPNVRFKGVVDSEVGVTPDADLIGTLSSLACPMCSALSTGYISPHVSRCGYASKRNRPMSFVLANQQL